MSAITTKRPRAAKVWRARRPARLGRFTPVPELLGQAPCGCAVWPDVAVLCPTREAARDLTRCLEVIDRHEEAIRAHERRMGFRRHLRNWSAFIFQAASRWRQTKLEGPTESARRAVA